MSPVEAELLDGLLTSYVGDVRLAPAERREMLLIASGRVAKDAAALTGISPETVRCRRNRLYRKLEVEGTADILVGLLALSLDRLAREDFPPCR
jgi:DNA-binding CsgD family transcriptional regulator